MLSFVIIILNSHEGHRVRVTQRPQRDVRITVVSGIVEVRVPSPSPSNVVPVVTAEKMGGDIANVPPGESKRWIRYPSIEFGLVISGVEIILEFDILQYQIGVWRGATTAPPAPTLPSIHTRLRFHSIDAQFPMDL